MKKKFFATLVAAMLLVLGLAMTASAASYSNWFDIGQLNAIDVKEDLRYEASREEVSLIISEFLDAMELLPTYRQLEFDDEREFITSTSYRMITRLSSTGIVYGYPDGCFGPRNDITRAEALAMVLRTVDFLNLETDSYRRGNYFTDTEGHWAEVYCTRAYEQGLVSGRGNGRFFPDDNITREEIIQIMVNLVGKSNNPLISAIDKIYDLEFSNLYYDEEESKYYDDRYYDDRYYDDRYYDDRYYDDRYYDDEDERPVVNTGNSTSSSTTSSSSSTTSSEPLRPNVQLPENSSNISSTDGSKPTRTTVDTTTSSTDTSRPNRETVDTTTSSTQVSTSVVGNSGEPARPKF